MRRRWLVSVLALCVAPVAMSLSSVAGDSAPGTSRYVVVLKSSAVASDVASTATGLGATVDSLFGTVDTLVVSLPRLALGTLQHDPRVAYVTPDRPVQLLAGTTPATLPAVPTGVARIGAAPALNPDGTVAVTTSPARKAAVALLDTGIMNRPDLNVVGGHDCSSSSGDLSGSTADDNGHGTHVAGIVAGRGIPGVIGVSPGTPLYAVRVFDADGSGSTSAVICGLNWVAKNAAADNIKVVNMSLGGQGSDDGNCGATDQDPLHTAVCRVTGAGVTVVAAAGNESGDLAGSAPAAYGEVLAVTAMADFDGKPGGLVSTSPCSGRQKDDTAATFSDYAVPGSADANHTIAAPGVCITSTWNDGGTKTISGTSMASPHVAGLVARCIDAGPCTGMTPARIIAKLRADAAARPADQGFVGDMSHPIAGKYYGNLAHDTGY
jgi:subtilisin family serine protease